MKKKLETFLDKVASYILEAYGGKEREITIVLPGRRAALFLRESIARKSNRIIWSPEIYSIDDFISSVSGLEIIDPFETQLELYTVYSRIKKDETESLESFLKWSSILVGDFNEVDSYLADPKKLFSNLCDIREIENWSLGSLHLTDFQKNYIRFWQMLGEMYSGLRTLLLESNRGYQGLAYRIAYEKCKSGPVAIPSQKIIFAGFNALSLAEEKIIDQLYQEGKADVLWDADDYYLSNSYHEAGKFLRQLIGKWPLKTGVPFRHVEKNYRKKKNINLIAVPGNIAQARYAGELLGQYLPVNHHNETAMVMADEKLLFPILYGLPSNTEGVNVTMGFPFRQTPVASLVMSYLDLLLSAKGKTENPVFHHAALTLFLSHPLVKQCAPRVVSELLRTIVKNNQVYCSLNSLPKIKNAEKILTFIGKVDSPGEAVQKIYLLIDLIRESLKHQEGEAKNITNEFLFNLAQVLKKLRVFMKKPGMEVELASMRNVVQQMIGSTKVAFMGEPLKGLQLMGMLETRTLDFKNVILVSANENILPSGNISNSFIPHDLKKIFSLPVFTDKDAVFGYHFYRLIQRAENIHILFNSQSDTFNSGEKSRFLTQLTHELPDYSIEAVIRETFYSPVIKTSPERPVLTVKKGQKEIELLNEINNYGFSPTQLNSYLDCEFLFYLRYIAELSEAEEVEEAVGADTLGTVIHDTLEELHKPLTGKKLTAEDIQGMISETDKILGGSFTKKFSESGISKGKNHLIYQVAREMVLNFLKHQLSLVKGNEEIRIESLEEKITGTLDLPSMQIKFRGIADRVEKTGGSFRVVDYKTGSVEDKEVKIENWDELFSGEKGKALQLMVYSWMYWKSHGRISTPGIYSLRKIKNGIKLLNTPEGILSESSMKEFEAKLKISIEKMFDTKDPFTQTDNPDTCEYCAYRRVCGR